MPGAGSSTAITRAESPARCLDLTRLVSRAGRQATGVDRVERAYLEHLSHQSAPLFGLVRTALGYLLIDHAGCRAFASRLGAGEIGRPTLFSRLARRGDPARAGMESDLRRDAVGRARPRKLGAMLRRHLPEGTSYINVGHTNLGRDTLSGLRAVPGLRIGVMIHDTIPLDLPEMQREGSVTRFQMLFDRVAAEADTIIANSRATAADIARHSGRRDGVIAAHLGVSQPRLGTPPIGPWSRAPCFVALGTIEPRKNHGFLLDLWERLVAEHGADAPHLLILGSRGWRNERVFARLDAAPPHIHELPGLEDPEVFALLAASRGLVFPSLAEGYGLPPLEAAALGVPALCNDLPVTREVLGDKGIYADVADGYLWREHIMRLARQDDRDSQPAEWAPPGWDAHFKTVLSYV
ncbi:glycosyltransferase family 1 protein [Roseivivax sp. THAF30]|uniref:glycosyltransferase family 4 protein n=1 Tax=Roseivivax sp. THAF30 TaxID=2587852 RepID=UPI001267A3D9|nr:glycosyltransferase family 1 protein [Roseivivax sp. THAF30]QFT61436.1 Glycosyl transferases group 1 [Roseivivax sp. THAF30]